jgi:hypothetical protein
MTIAVRRVVFILLFLSLASTTAPLLVARAREAARLLPLTYRERLSRTVGFYDVAQRLKTELPPGEPIAMILRKPTDVDIAIFFNYYMYPIKSRIYYDLGLYRNDPKRAEIVVGVDAERNPPFEWMPYPELRAEHAGNDFVVSDLKPSSEALRSMDVPLVCSLDGPAPEWYATEAVIENTSDAPAHVRMELMPSRRTFELTIEPRGRMVANDLVYQAFKVMEQGWLRVVSDQPVRGGFWFVNRGRRVSAAIPVMTSATSLRVVANANAKFYVVNPSETGMMVKMPHGEFFVGGLDVISGNTAPTFDASSDVPFFTFASWRGSKGETVFAWPESVQ